MKQEIASLARRVGEGWKLKNKHCVYFLHAVGPNEQRPSRIVKRFSRNTIFPVYADVQSPGMMAVSRQQDDEDDRTPTTTPKHRSQLFALPYPPGNPRLAPSRGGTEPETLSRCNTERYRIRQNIVLHLRSIRVVPRDKKVRYRCRICRK